MSVSYWAAKKIGVLIVLFYVAIMGILVGAYYYTGAADPGLLARLYPPGAYAGSDKYQTVWEIYGFSTDEFEKRMAAGGIEIISYGDDAVVIRRDGKQQTVSIGDVIKYLANRDSGEIENALSPMYGPLNALLRIHLNFLRRVEAATGGDEDGYRRLIVPKIVVSCAYLGIVLITFIILKRIDRSPKKYRGGYSLIYGSFIFWPIAVIIVSFSGISVLDVIRHLPDSYVFMHWYIVGGWAAIFAWPLFVGFLSILDIINAFLRVGFNQACAHIGVLAAGIISIPLVTVGVLFALLVVSIYLGYRVVKKLVLPASMQRR